MISWLALRGHCRDCDTGISPTYPLTEAATAALFVAVVLVKGRTSGLWLDLCFVAALIAITRIDLEHWIIPDRILAPLALIALALVALLSPGQLISHLIGGAAAGGFLLVAVLVYPRGMGLGDVKLAAVMGLVLGASVVPALFVALIIGTLVGIGVIAVRGVALGRKTAIPFGPFLALGGIVALFAGEPLIHLYLHAAGL